METNRVLKKYFEKKKASHPGYSLRQLSLRIGVSPSFISRIFSGERPVPFPLLLRLCRELDIDAEMTQALRESHLATLEGLPSAKAPLRGKAEIRTKMEEWEPGSKPFFQILRQWFYIPIMEFTKLNGFDGRIETIALRLGLSPTAVEIAVREMISLSLLKSENGLIKPMHRKLRLASPKALKEIRRFHDQMLGRAQQCLRTETDTDDFRRRLITGITVTASPEKIDEAKKKLGEFLYELANELTEEQGSEVYHIAVQLFPLTRRK
jgi:uncharacterized protein (TIGR02147 family)